MNDEGASQKKATNKDGTSCASRAAEPSATAQFPELVRQREQKIHEHLGVVLGSPDTLQACMGPILCDILETCAVLKAALGEKIAVSVSPMVGVKESMPLIEVYLQAIRQAERLANLNCRIRESQSSQPKEGVD